MQAHMHVAHVDGVCARGWCVRTHLEEDGKDEFFSTEPPNVVHAYVRGMYALKIYLVLTRETQCSTPFLLFRPLPPPPVEARQTSGSRKAWVCG